MGNLGRGNQSGLMRTMAAHYLEVWPRVSESCMADISDRKIVRARHSRKSNGWRLVKR